MQHCAVILLVLTNTPDPLSIAVDCMALCAESSLFFLQAIAGVCVKGVSPFPCTVL